MKWVKLYESFKDYRDELDKLHKELEEKGKKYLSNILRELAECMHDLTDNWEYEVSKQVETREITILYTFKVPISQFRKFTEDFKSSTDIVLDKLEPTKIRLNEITTERGNKILSFDYINYELIGSTDIPASERVSNWSNYYNDLIDCLFDVTNYQTIDVNDDIDVRWSEFIKKTVPIYKRFEINPDDKVEIILRIII